MKSAKWIHDRCIEEGDCWIWRQALNGTGQPVSSVVVDGKRKTMLVRRVALALHLGREPLPTELTVATCTNSQCCNPDHLRAGNRSAVMMMASKRGTIAKGKQQSIRMQRSARNRKNSKLTHELVQFIRDKYNETGSALQATKALLEERGVSIVHSHVHRICVGQAWAPTNPFSI